MCKHTRPIKLILIKLILCFPEEEWKITLSHTKEDSVQTGLLLLQIYDSADVLKS